MLHSEQIFRLKINTGKFDQFVDEILDKAIQPNSSIVCVANVHMFMESTKDKKLFSIINNADLVTPDGLPLCWALKFLNGTTQERVAGMDLLPNLLKKASFRGTPVFFYGGTQDMLSQAQVFLEGNYPHLHLAGFYSPPFRELTLQEEARVIRLINDSGAGLVFVVLGCPKQEKWMDAMKGKINAVMVGIGGAFPVLLGRQPRAPKWMQKVGLEWLFRLYKEPRRLIKRYATTNSLFIYLLLKEKLGFTKKTNIAS